MNKIADMIYNLAGDNTNWVLLIGFLFFSYFLVFRMFTYVTFKGGGSIFTALNKARALANYKQELIANNTPEDEMNKLYEEKKESLNINVVNSIIFDILFQISMLFIISMTFNLDSKYNVLSTITENTSKKLLIILIVVLTISEVTRVIKLNKRESEGKKRSTLNFVLMFVSVGFYLWMSNSVSSIIALYLIGARGAQIILDTYIITKKTSLIG